MTIPEDVAITSIDAEKHELVGEIAVECSELTAVTLWLMAERVKGSASQYYGLISSLPVRAIPCQLNSPSPYLHVVGLTHITVCRRGALLQSCGMMLSSSPTWLAHLSCQRRVQGQQLSGSSGRL